MITSVACSLSELLKEGKPVLLCLVAALVYVRLSFNYCFKPEFIWMRYLKLLECINFFIAFMKNNFQSSSLWCIELTHDFYYLSARLCLKMPVGCINTNFISEERHLCMCHVYFQYSFTTQSSFH